MRCGKLWAEAEQIVSPGAVGTDPQLCMRTERGQGELRPCGEEHPEFHFPELKFPHCCTFPARGSVLLLLPFPRQSICTEIILQMKPRTRHCLKSSSFQWEPGAPHTLCCSPAQGPFPHWEHSHGHQSPLEGQLCPSSCPPEQPGQLKIAFLVRVFHETSEPPYLPAAPLAQDELQMEQQLQSFLGPGRTWGCCPLGCHCGVTAASGLAAKFGGTETFLISWGQGY